MSFKKISKVYTEKVAEWMAKGYEINVGTMRGSQGEIARVDLTNGKDIVRIYVDKDYVGCYDRKYNDYIVKVVMVKVVVGRVNDIKPYINNGGMIIWNDKLTTIDETIFYEIGRGGNWFGTKEEFEAAVVKRSERYNNKKYIFSQNKKDVTDLPNRKEIAVNALRNLKGFKRVKVDDIEKIIRYASTDSYYYHYEIIAKNRCVIIDRHGATVCE